MRSTLLFALSVVSLLSACTRKEDKVVLPDLPAIVYKDMPYGADSLQKMDVYLPAGRSADHTPVVLLIHGGGWKQGDKSGFNSAHLDSILNLNGYAFISMNYRLAVSNATRFPTQLDDVDAAISFIEGKTQEWQIKGNEMATMGSSAGAHLSLLEAFDGGMRRDVKTVMSMAGFSDLTDTSVVANPNIVGDVNNLLGAEFINNQLLWTQASPIFYMANAVPVLIFQGDADVVAYPIQALRLKDSLDKRQIPCKYVVWNGYGHGTFPDWNQTEGTMVDWLKVYLPR
jgi:acetyl esterase/lipase